MTKPIQLEKGHNVKIIGDENDSQGGGPYHYIQLGNIGKVTNVYDDGWFEVYAMGTNGYMIHQEVARSELRKMPDRE